MSILLFYLLVVLQPAAQALPYYDSFQLQQLVNKAEEQVQAAKELIKHAKENGQALARAEQILDRLSVGIDQPIKDYQGTQTYEKALASLQSEAGFVNGRAPFDAPTTRQKIDRFQSASVSAGVADLENQEKLQQALKNAAPGFVPKIQAQAQLASWQTDIRSTEQLTQILAMLNGLREDLNSRGDGGFSTFLNGAEKQNQQARQGGLHAQ